MLSKDHHTMSFQGEVPQSEEGNLFVKRGSEEGTFTITRVQDGQSAADGTIVVFEQPFRSAEAAMTAYTKARKKRLRQGARRKRFRI